MCIQTYVYGGLIFLAGYGFSIGLGDLVTSRVVEKLHKLYGPKREPASLPRYTGILDRILYTSALLFGFKEFIPVWLVVKAARGWRVTDKEGADEIPKHIIGRYNIFFIGNALCVIFGVGGALIIRGLCRLFCVEIPFLNIFASK